jgi:hypothetical protein
LPFTIDQRQLKILHDLRRRFYPDQPLDTARDEELHCQAQRIEAQASELEDRLSVHGGGMPLP